jgi:hypothetical protein
MHTLREAKGAYALNSSRESDTLTLDNTVLWQKNAEAFETKRGPARKTLELGKNVGIKPGRSLFTA